jgi:hypothetical protein|uniref:Uncharacterized protein n=1 Tax=Siphoviridae sp. ctGuJ10 TaxID=2825418 RepID=A0A8S5PSW7_9CAUD|nr:MAG TPA: hypothetical protein [Siphoviridae sp. ctGuJ10]
MALQGVCEIELRDENGNIVQKTKDKNMITNGLSNIINLDYSMVVRLFGLYTSEYEFHRNIYPIIQKVIGGIYLFSEVQNESVDNIVPNLSKLVGTCSLSKSVINNYFSGMWNINESSLIYNDAGSVIGIKFVYDFGTDKSNGTIKSVSLTTDVGARTVLKDLIGFNFFSGGSTSSSSSFGNFQFNKINPVLEIINRNQTDYSKGYNMYSMNSSYPIITITDSSEIIVVHNVDTTAKNVVIRKYKIKDSVSLNGLLIDDKLAYNEQYFDILKELTFDYSDILIGNDTFSKERVIGSIYCYENYIYMTNAYNKTINIKKIDIQNLQISSSITRTFELGGLNMGVDMTNVALKPIYIYKNYYIISQYVSGELFTSLLFINQSDLTIAKRIKYDLYNESHSAKGLGIPAICGYIGDYVYIRYTYSVGTSGSLDICKTMYADNELNIYELDNEYNMSFYIPIYQKLFKFPYMICREYQFSFSSSYLQGNMSNNSLAVSPYIKFTIDNLQTHVTKTASQTMKVIYTIKDVEE